MVYWWAIASEADGSHGVGVNTRNMNPADLALVERRIQFDTVTATLRDKKTKHREDVADYA